MVPSTEIQSELGGASIWGKRMSCVWIYQGWLVKDNHNPTVWSGSKSLMCCKMDKVPGGSSPTWQLGNTESSFSLSVHLLHCFENPLDSTFSHNPVLSDADMASHVWLSSS